MNLRELLLQLAGENEESLKLDELISRNIERITVRRNFSNGIELITDQQDSIDDIIKKIDNLLLENNYESYDIVKKEGPIIEIRIN